VPDSVSVAVLATLDSKHDAIRFVCDALRRAGVTPWLVDLSLRPHSHGFADISGAEVAGAAGFAWDALGKLSRADAAQAIVEGEHRAAWRESRSECGGAGICG